MKEVYREEHVEDAGNPSYEAEELAGYFRKLIAIHGGEYSESLIVKPDGRVSIDSRNGDGAPALLPSLTSTRIGGQGPRVEEVYRILKNTAEHLPGYKVSINEDRTSGNIFYRISRLKE
jgi:hypothetical protein